jgi:hypothetical protein
VPESLSGEGGEIVNLGIISLKKWSFDSFFIGKYRFAKGPHDKTYYRVFITFLEFINEKFLENILFRGMLSQ